VTTEAKIGSCTQADRGEEACAVRGRGVGNCGEDEWGIVSQLQLTI